MGHFACSTMFASLPSPSVLSKALCGVSRCSYQHWRREGDMFQQLWRGLWFNRIKVGQPTSYLPSQRLSFGLGFCPSGQTQSKLPFLLIHIPSRPQMKAMSLHSSTSKEAETRSGHFRIWEVIGKFSRLVSNGCLCSWNALIGRWKCLHEHSGPQQPELIQAGR